MKSTRRTMKTRHLAALLAALLLTLGAFPAASATMEERIEAMSKAIALDPSAPVEDNSAQVIAHTTRAQEEIARLYGELKALRGKRFAELGFSVNHREAADWKRRTEAARERIEGDEYVDSLVRTAPGNLLLLGLDKAWRRGGQSAYSPGYEKSVQDALNWKMEE